MIDLPSGWFLTSPPADPWSPDGRYLAVGRYSNGTSYDTKGGLYLFDIEHPSQAPRHLDAGGKYYVWSPDGKWLAWVNCGFSDYMETPRWGSVLCTPVDGRKFVAIVEKAQISPFVWLQDGRMLFWKRPTVRGTDGSLGSPVATTVAGTQTPLTRIEWGDQRTWSKARPKLQSFARRIQRNMRLAAQLRFYERTGTGYDVLVDRQGNVVSLLGISGTPSGWSNSDPRENDDIMWTSVTSDTTFGVGYLGVNGMDEFVSSRLYVTALDTVRAGTSSVAGTPLDRADGTWLDGDWPRFSPRQPLVAYEDPKAGGVHVARLMSRRASSGR